MAGLRRFPPYLRDMQEEIEGHARDYGLVLGTVILYLMIILILNLIVDVIYAWLDPKVRY